MQDERSGFLAEERILPGAARAIPKPQQPAAAGDKFSFTHGGADYGSVLGREADFVEQARREIALVNEELRPTGGAQRTESVRFEVLTHGGAEAGPQPIKVNVFASHSLGRHTCIPLGALNRSAALLILDSHRIASSWLDVKEPLYVVGDETLRRMRGDLRLDVNVMEIA